MLLFELGDDVGDVDLGIGGSGADGVFGGFELAESAPEVVAGPEDVSALPTSGGVVAQRLDGELTPQPGERAPVRASSSAKP